MRQFVRGTNIRISKPLKDYTEKKLIQPLKKLTHHVRSVTVRFTDEDLSNQHSPVYAKALVILSTGKVIEVEQKNLSYYDAVNQLADRMKHVVLKNVDKLRDRRRR
ncbi:HPF/RaiA family ribosome-associated protein [Poriferisphaera sp. WC338]|uniref:HPF/RaiA family ribosome-associated protein n=1 Tax=Poriferisphaera sp. WC338 TaxID=3425129 RepID=UPI003D81BC06